ncbi:hypothetical protein [Nocardia sp. CA-135398]|uniref:hypothetical protein n=1 Tax=Nocardia sp. CA-135398 TaxID=3239977 RepID=UPI003D95AE8F
MTTHNSAPHPGQDPSKESGPYADLLTEVTADTGRFGHRQHLHLTYLAVRRYGTSRAIELVSDGIQRTARYQGAPQKYHATVSRAWVELVGHHVIDTDAADFDTFIDHYPGLLDKRLLTRFYRTTTLADPVARTGWVEPDLTPFPWQHNC